MTRYHGGGTRVCHPRPSALSYTSTPVPGRQDPLHQLQVTPLSARALFHLSNARQAAPATPDARSQGDTCTTQGDTFSRKFTFCPWTLFHVFQVCPTCDEPRGWRGAQRAKRKARLCHAWQPGLSVKRRDPRDGPRCPQALKSASRTAWSPPGGTGAVRPRGCCGRSRHWPVRRESASHSSNRCRHPCCQTD